MNDIARAGWVMANEDDFVPETFSATKQGCLDKYEKVICEETRAILNKINYKPREFRGSWCIKMNDNV